MSAVSADFACAYASLILQDEDVGITADRISAILKAAGVRVDSIWPEMYVSALQNCNMKDIVNNISTGVGSAPAAPAQQAVPEEKSAPKPAKEEKKPVEEEESDEEMGFSLFG
ncbi:Ribosomal 60s domain containing protein [Trichuris trichiura]|uniref:Large ribosomal subunit protein P1 n=1 Tax=Trichuris trichiura TaxID=36087 RepID=A0A077Z0E6_TRITR|nr:Ribosomal 60s domain containing protein [Trichuris trichiura]